MLESIVILGKTYKIDMVDDQGIPGYMGRANRQYQRIVLSKSNAPEQLEDTLLHEVIHIIDSELAIGLTEENVQRLACGLHSAGYRREGVNNA